MSVCPASSNGKLSAQNPPTSPWDKKMWEVTQAASLTHGNSKQTLCFLPLSPSKMMASQCGGGDQNGSNKLDQLPHRRISC